MNYFVHPKSLKYKENIMNKCKDCGGRLYSDSQREFGLCSPCLGAWLKECMREIRFTPSSLTYQESS